VAAQVKEPLVPTDHLATVALGHDRSEVVIDALARDAAQPVKHPDVTL